MLRDDYEKLQDYLIKNDNEKYGLMSYKNNKDYVYSFMKVYDKNTHLIEKDVYNDYGLGLYVDIFPIDGYDENKLLRAKITKNIKKRQLSCYTFQGIYNKDSVVSTIIRNIFLIIFTFSNANTYEKN